MKIQCIWVVFQKQNENITLIGWIFKKEESVMLYLDRFSKKIYAMIYLGSFQNFKFNTIIGYVLKN